MAKLRKANAYRRLERPNTRKSRYRNKSYVRASPHNRIAKYGTGNLSAKFAVMVLLKSTRNIQVRHNALESARKAGNKILETALGKEGYKLKVRSYPHHVLRENPLAAGAGADRMSTGMSHSFGKPIGLAARLKVGTPIFEVCVNQVGVAKAKDAMKAMRCKLPCDCKVEIINKQIQA